MKLRPVVLKKIEGLLDPSLTPEDILDKEELQYITKYRHHARIRDFFLVPQHTRSTTTYRIQKIITDNFNFAEFVERCIEDISCEYEVAIDLGYFTVKPTDGDSLHFIYPAKCNSFISSVITTEEKLDIFLDEVQIASKDLLMYAFEKHQNNKSFSESGFVPRTATVLDIYVTTF